MRVLWLFIVGVVAATLCSPFLRSIAWFADEGVLLHAADRMLRGERLYVDFFEILAPGGFLITAGWLNLTELSFPAARMLALISIVGIACFIYLACEQVSRSAPLSAALALAWVVMTQGEPTQLSHHWLTTTFCCASLWAFLYWIGEPQRWGWLVTAGMLAGMSATITQSRGALVVLAGLAAFQLGRKELRLIVIYCASAAAVPVTLTLYLAAQDLLAAAIENVILWPARNYHFKLAMPYGANPSPQGILINFTFPIAAMLALLVVIRNGRAAIADRTFRLCAAIAAAAFLGLLVRADSLHIAFASPLTLPLIVYSVVALKLDILRKYRAALAAVAVVAMIMPLWVFVSEIQRATNAPEIETPRGTIKLMVRIAGAEDAMRSLLNLPPGDAVFFYPYSPLLPFLSSRTHPSRVDLFVPQYTTPEQYKEAEEAILQSAAWVMLDRATMASLSAIFPVIGNRRPPEEMHFQRVLETHFSPYQTFGAFELRKEVR